MSLNLCRTVAYSRCISAARQQHGRHSARNILTGRRLLSSEQTASSTAASETSSTASAPPAESVSLGTITRHGKGDACISLNVGGKEFHTLRSTVNSNPVLSEHVARAESNHEILKNGAVFIDRDPEHFGFILKHLRNRMEALSSKNMDPSSLPILTKTYIDLPEEGGKFLRELYVEASFYRIPELQKAVSQRHGFLSKVLFAFNKNLNPIDSAVKLAARINATLIAVGSLGTAATAVFVAVKTGLHDLEWAFDKIGLKKEWNWLLKKLGAEKNSAAEDEENVTSSQA